MGKKKTSSVKKLDEQIKKLSSTKSEDKTPVANKKDLVRKVKAKQIDEKIEKNKSTSTAKKKKKGYYYSKANVEKTKKIKKVKEEYDVDECTKELTDIYSKEITVKKDPNEDFFSNEFLNNIEEKIMKVHEKIGEQGMKVLEKIVDVDEMTFDTNGEEMPKWDKLSLITLGMSLVFAGLCILLILLLVWICTY